MHATAWNWDPHLVTSITRATPTKKKSDIFLLHGRVWKTANHIYLLFLTRSKIKHSKTQQIEHVTYTVIYKSFTGILLTYLGAYYIKIFPYATQVGPLSCYPHLSYWWSQILDALEVSGASATQWDEMLGQCVLPTPWQRLKCHNKKWFSLRYPSLNAIQTNMDPVRWSSGDLSAGVMVLPGCLHDAQYTVALRDFKRLIDVDIDHMGNCTTMPTVTMNGSLGGVHMDTWRPKRKRPM